MEKNSGGLGTFYWRCRDLVKTWVRMFCARRNDAEVANKKAQDRARRAVKSEMDPSPLLAELSLKKGTTDRMNQKNSRRRNFIQGSLCEIKPPLFDSEVGLNLCVIESELHSRLPRRLAFYVMS